MKICTLSSGSSGNAAFIRGGSTRVMVDCGHSGKHIIDCLQQAGEDAAGIDYILVTHEHTDHIKGVGVFSRKFNVPIYASGATWNAMRGRLGDVAAHNVRTFTSNEPFELGDMAVTAFKTPHDAADSHGFRFECVKDGKVAVLATDIGHISPGIEVQLKGANAVILEANHDIDMLENGDYPFYLKERILSDFGHLSNTVSAKLAARLIENGTQHLILAHLSQDNNSPACVVGAMENAFGRVQAKAGSDFEYCLAERLEPSKVFEF